MRRWTTVVLFTVISMSMISAFGQEAEKRVQGYRKSFELAGNEVKLQLLNDPDIVRTDGIVPLYLDALNYVINTISQSQIDPVLRDIGLSSVTFLKNSGKNEGNNLMLRLFQADRDNRTRIAILQAYGSVAVGDRQIIDWMNAFLLEQNSIVRTGRSPDIQVMMACAQALARINDPSTFPVAFDSWMLRYTDEYTKLLGQVLAGFTGSLKDHLMPIITAYSPAHKLEALKYAVSSDKLSRDRKLEIAHAALKVALTESALDSSGNQALRNIRFMSSELLTAEMYSAATPDILKNFDLVVLYFNRGAESVNGVLESIASLGKLGNHDAALKLTQFMDLINLYTGKDRPFDEQITLAVIRNLGILGDSVAFDSLILATYLNYSDTVKKAAREANMSLKW